MVGVKGRSGGRRYSKSEDEKKSAILSYRMTQDTATMLRILAVGKYGTCERTLSKVLDEAIYRLYQEDVVDKYWESKKDRKEL